MRGIDHLVLCAGDMQKARRRYREMGFNLTPIAQHPFGTANSFVQFCDGSSLELLVVDDVAKLTGAQPGHFSFGGFARHFIEEGPKEGFAMLALDSQDADEDRQGYSRAGLEPYAPFVFSRQAKLPDGEEVTLQFSLTFLMHQDIREAAFFSCQRHEPEYFRDEKKVFQAHANSATGIDKIILLADRPLKYISFFQGFTGIDDVETWDEGFSIATGRGDISVISPDEWHKHYPDAFAPDLPRGPRLAAFQIAVDFLEAVQDCLRKADITRMLYGRGVVVPPNEALGVMVEFVEK